MRMLPGLRTCFFLLLLSVIDTVEAAVTIEPKGKFIDDCSLPGEQKADWLHPSHPFCAQLSRDRFLWVYAVRMKLNGELECVGLMRAEGITGPALEAFGCKTDGQWAWELRENGKVIEKAAD